MKTTTTEYVQISRQAFDKLVARVEEVDSDPIVSAWDPFIELKKLVDSLAGDVRSRASQKAVAEEMAKMISEAFKAKFREFGLEKGKADEARR